jgi:hypothetical protein
MHDGHYPGYRARYTVWSDEKFGVAIMCNGDTADLKLVVDDIAQVFFDVGADRSARMALGEPLQTGASAEPRVVDEDDPRYEFTSGDLTDPLPSVDGQWIPPKDAGIPTINLLK